MLLTRRSIANSIAAIFIAGGLGCASGPMAGTHGSDGLAPPAIQVPVSNNALRPPPAMQPVFRAQSPDNNAEATRAVAEFEEVAPGNSALTRSPMRVSGGEVVQAQYAAPGTGDVVAVNNNAPFLPPQGSSPTPLPPPPDSGGYFDPAWPPVATPGTVVPPTRDVEIDVEETQTGRFMFGVGVNSDAGLSGQITIDERNFDLFRPPTSWADFVNGSAFRGAGQGFRIEAAPGTQVQRYLFTFTEPYLFDTDISTSVSGFFFNRAYQDWQEERLGGRVGFGYRLAPDLSVASTLRAENVNISRPRVIGVPELDRVIGDNDIYSGRFSITHDTRDLPFAPTQGHFIDLAYEQAFGEFDFPRAEADLRKYYLLRERPDGSGRHTLGVTGKVGVTGTDTPIFENYYAGGYSSLRGFNFRGASPTQNGVQVGGRLRLLGSVEYMFPLSADDMIKGVAFVDAGTVERNIEVNGDNFRVAPGLGLRINIPALGPAPLAFDFAVPVMHAPGDNIQNFSFFFGFGR
jgi:outer membrane protein insertion porin family